MADNQFNPTQRLKKLTPTFVITILVVLVAIAAALSSFFVVDATEQAVVTRLGKYSRTVGAGLQFKLPFGLDRNYNVPSNVVQTEESREEYTKTTLPKNPACLPET